eukprot:9100459-Alexandrium_andersonii.AAC.1
MCIRDRAWAARAAWSLRITSRTSFRVAALLREAVWTKWQCPERGSSAHPANRHRDMALRALRGGDEVDALQ